MNEHINTFTGETIIYNDHYHRYYALDGTALQGASSYAKQFGDTFNADQIIPRLAKQWGMSIADIKQLWAINADISNSFGSSVHHAMELWFRYHKVGREIQERKGMEYNYALPKNVHLRDIVLSFVDTFGDIDGVPEATLSAVEKKMAGRTDLIQITGEKSCRVGDFKTNNEMSTDKLLKYQHQLSFYADILTYHGWTVEGLDIYYHDGQTWTLITLDILPVILSVPENVPVLSTVPPRPPVFKGV